MPTTSNISVNNTTSLYGLGSVSILTNPQQLLALLYSNGNVNFSLTSNSTQVQAFALGGGTSSFGNTQVAAYLPTYTGSLNNSSSIVTINANVAAANVNISTINANLAAANVNISTINANVTAANVNISTINANLGAFQTYANLTFGTSSYGNANVAAYLPVFGGNILAGNVTIVSNLTANGTTVLANATVGNLTTTGAASLNTLTTTGIIRSTANIVAASNTASTSNTTGALVVAGTGGIGVGGAVNAGGIGYFNAAVPNTGALTGALQVPNGGAYIFGNLWVGGNINFTPNSVSTITGNSGVFYGNTAGFGALYAGSVSGFYIDPQTVISSSADYNGYVGILYGTNANPGSLASADIFLAPNNGTVLDGFINMGIASSAYNYPGYNLIKPNDGYLFVTGNTTTGGGNLILGTGASDDIVFVTNGINTVNEVMRITTANVVAIKSGLASTSNVTGALVVTGGIGANGAVTAGNLITSNGVFYANGVSYASTITGSYGNVQMQANLASNTNFAITTTGTVTAANLITSNGLFWANGINYSTTIPGTYGNTQVQSYLSTINPLRIGNAQSGVGATFIGNSTPSSTAAVSIVAGGGTTGVSLNVGSSPGNLSITSQNGIQVTNTSLRFTNVTLFSGGTGETGGAGNIEMNANQTSPTNYTGFINNANAVSAGSFTTTRGLFYPNGVSVVPGTTSSVSYANIVTTSASIGNLTFSGSYSETVYTSLGTTGTLTINPNLGTVQTTTLTGNITIGSAQLTQLTSGQSVTVVITQPSIGGPFYLTSTGVKYSGNLKALSTTASATDILNILNANGTYLAAIVKGYV